MKCVKKILLGLLLVIAIGVIITVREEAASAGRKLWIHFKT